MMHLYTNKTLNNNEKESVLILVVMDDALVLCKPELRDGRDILGLNPCCNG